MSQHSGMEKGEQNSLAYRRMHARGEVLAQISASLASSRLRDTLRRRSAHGSAGAQPLTRPRRTRLARAPEPLPGRQKRGPGCDPPGRLPRVRQNPMPRRSAATLLIGRDAEPSHLRRPRGRRRARAPLAAPRPGQAGRLRANMDDGRRHRDGCRGAPACDAQRPTDRLGDLRSRLSSTR